PAIPTTTPARGTSVYDTSVFSASRPIAPTGTVTYSFYANSTGTGTPVFTDTEPVGSPTISTAPLGAGSYSFVAHYNGDSSYAPATAALEPLVVAKASPAISTQ